MSRKFFTIWFILLPDALLFYISLWISIGLRYYHAGLDAQGTTGHLRAFTPLYALWLVVFFIHGMFDFRVFRRYSSLIFNLVSAMVVSLLLSIVYFYFQPNLILTPRRFLLIDVAVSFIMVLGWQLVLKYFLKNRIREGIYLFSFNGELQDLEHEILQHTYAGFKVLGHLDAQTLPAASFERNSAIIVPDNLHANPAVSGELYKIRTLGIAFYNHKDFYESLLRRVYLSDLNELWFLENINYQEKRLYEIIKRLVDIISGIIGLLVFIATYPLIALAIRLETAGPVLFTQERVGKNGKVFKIYKYRTMSGGRTDTWTQKNDPRITRVGNVLRKTRVDELPQAINLIRGDLALVGPRPEQVHIVRQLRRDIPFYDERNLVKPGITGWAQLNIYAGSLEETKTKLQYDLYYIKHRSFLFDLEIILKTIYYIFTWQGR